MIKLWLIKQDQSNFWSVETFGNKCSLDSERLNNLPAVTVCSWKWAWSLSTFSQDPSSPSLNSVKKKSQFCLWSHRKLADWSKKRILISDVSERSDSRSPGWQTETEISFFSLSPPSIRSSCLSWVGGTVVSDAPCVVVWRVSDEKKIV